MPRASTTATFTPTTSCVTTRGLPAGRFWRGILYRPKQPSRSPGPAAPGSARLCLPARRVAATLPAKRRATGQRPGALEPATGLREHRHPQPAAVCRDHRAAARPANRRGLNPCTLCLATATTLCSGTRRSQWTNNPKPTDVLANAAQRAGRRFWRAKRQNRARDFSQGKPGHFIAIGLLFTLVFVLLLVGVVKLVLHLAGL